MRCIWSSLSSINREKVEPSTSSVVRSKLEKDSFQFDRPALVRGLEHFAAAHVDSLPEAPSCPPPRVSPGVPLTPITPRVGALSLAAASSWNRLKIRDVWFPTPLDAVLPFFILEIRIFPAVI